MRWYTVAIVATAPLCYAREFIQRGNTTVFAAQSRVIGNDTVARLYQSCSLHDVSDQIKKTKASCVTDLFRHLLIQVGVSPSGYSVAAGRTGFGNVTISYSAALSDEEQTLRLPTSFDYVTFHDVEVGGLKLQAHEKNGTVTSSFVRDLEQIASAFTAEAFIESDSWTYHVCNSTGELLFYGLIVAEKLGFALNIEDLPLPSCTDTLGNDRGTGEDTSSNNSSLHQPSLNQSSVPRLYSNQSSSQSTIGSPNASSCSTPPDYGL